VLLGHVLPARTAGRRARQYSRIAPGSAGTGFRQSDAPTLAKSLMPIPGAFSSEAETGSHKENAIKQKVMPIGTGSD
jgi:hypothetical protein